MKILAPTQYDHVRPLFAPLEFNLVVHSVLANHTIGRVYADNAQRPSVALLWSMMDTVMLAGDAGQATVQEDLRRLLQDEMMPHARSRHVPGFSVYLDSSAWQPHLPALLPGLTLQPIRRRAFRLSQLRVDWREETPPGVTVQRIDADFLTRRDLQGMDPVLGWVLSFWPRPADFVHHGVGFAVIENGAIGSWCLSVYAAENALEFGVETAVAYRSRGFATLAAAACLQHCVAHGLVPHWHCNLDNVPSVRVAEKLGFVPVRDYTAFWVPFL